MTKLTKGACTKLHKIADRLIKTVEKSKTRL